MTTIAIKDNSMAADGQISWGSLLYQTNYDKIMKYSGCLYGFAGSVEDIELMKALIKGEPINPGNLECNVLMLTPKNKAFLVSYVEGAGMVYQKVPNPTAIGSGQLQAIGALKAGASAREAVKIACETDIYSGGTIRVKKL